MKNGMKPLHYWTKLLCFFVFLSVSALPLFAHADQPAVPAIAGDAANPGMAVPGTATTGAGTAGPASMMGSFLPILLMFGVVYFFMMRPQQKRAKEQQSMISALKHGDEIVTNSGFLGRVTGIAEKVVTVELADNVKVKMLKSQVGQVIKGDIKEITV